MRNVKAKLRIASYLFISLVSFAALYHLAAASLPGDCGVPAGDAVRIARAADTATLAVVAAALVSRALVRYIAGGPGLAVYIVYLAAAGSTRLLEALRPAAASLTAADTAMKVVVLDAVLVTAVFVEAGTRLAVEVIDIVVARKINKVRMHVETA